MKNIFLANASRGFKYGAKGRPISHKYPTIADKIAHVENLKREFNLAIESIKAIKAQNEDAIKGYYVDFSGDAINNDFSLKAFENSSVGIKLLNVNQNNETIKATVYIPEKKEEKFNHKFDSYKESISSDKVKSADFVESVNKISPANLSSFWTSSPKDIPNDIPVWCELWVRYEFKKKDSIEYVKENTVETLTKIGIPYREQTIEFPERLVFLIKANRQKLEELITKFAYVAEMQKAAEVNSVFTDMSTKEQSEFIADLLSRKHTDLSTNVSVCLLDTGVNENHALLSEYVKSTDCVLDGISSRDLDGHGSNMAGIILYNDLEPLLEDSKTVVVNHNIESVKIYTRFNKNDKPELYGQLTEKAVYSAEIENPASKRIICMALTSPKIDNPDSGNPSSWSASIDKIVFNDEQEEKRFFLVSAGNVAPSDYKGQEYPQPNIINTVQNPSQAWNAISVGAYAGKDFLENSSFKGFRPLVSKNNLSPFSTTSVMWSKWAVKPEILFDGGNMCTNGSDVSDCEDLSLLTTSRDGSKLTTINATSSATAQAAWFASQIYAAYPDVWPETVRALMVHSADWTDGMKHFFLKEDTKTNRKNLLRTCGYGIPNMQKALECMNNSVNLIIQDEIQPFVRNSASTNAVYNEMKLIDLPWDKDQLQQLENTPVKLKVTLSYYIEPSPGNRGWKEKYTYQSFGLKFELKKENESEEEFIKRIDFAMRDDSQESDYKNNSGNEKLWYLGANNRNKGCIRSDFTVDTTAIQIANIDKIAIIPESGWWKNRLNMKRYNNEVRYSLVVTISTPEKDIDLYTPIIAKIGTAIKVKV